MNFVDKLIERAKSNVKKIVLPEAEEERILLAAHRANVEGFAHIILLGNEKEIQKKAIDNNVSLEGIQIIDPMDNIYHGDLTLQLLDIRSHKGMTLEEAKYILRTNKQYLATMLVKAGIADGLVSGSITSTKDVLRPALQIIKAKPGSSLVSSFFLMDTLNENIGEKGVFVYSDCGLIEQPDSEQLSEIAIQAAESFETLVTSTPKVAMLSYSTKGSASSSDVNKVIEATNLAKEKRNNILIDGEMQIDTAIVPEVAKLKMGDSEVAGYANTLIFPDLDAGNIAYKLTQRLTGGVAIGPLLQGIDKPVNDLSRGSTVEDIIAVIAVTVIQAQEKSLEDNK